MNIRFHDETLRVCFEQSSRATRRGGPVVGGSYLRAVQRILNVASFAELRTFLSLRIHPLTGDRRGQWAMSLHDRWRLVFVLVDAETIEIQEVSNHYDD